MKYIDGIKTENSFVNQIEDKINQIKQDEKERGAYMQYDLHLRDIEEEARAEGEKIGEKRGSLKERQNMILFQKNKGRKPEEIADWLGYSLEEVLKYYNSPNLNYT